MSLFINRELSWLDFNKRVLFQTYKRDIPLLERLNFLGITFSNLDEFIMVRLSYILNKIDADLESVDISGMTPDQEYDIIKKEITKFRNMQYACYDTILSELRENGIIICKYNELSEDEKKDVASMFSKSIFPLITPVAYDVTKEFPLLKSGNLSIITHIRDKSSDVICITSVDPKLDRIFKIGSKGGEVKYILLEDIIMAFINRIFVNKKILYNGVVRLLREADIELNHDDDIYLIDRIKENLYQRKISKPIFLELNEDIPKNIEKLLKREFDVKKALIYKTEHPMDLSFLKERILKNSELAYPKFHPEYPEDLVGESDIFSAIDASDFILHHPFESFNVVLKLLDEAAHDSNVLSIKQTLYRVSSEESPIIESLCKASENGKQVYVMLELKARFDEEQNLSLIAKLKNSGCKIIYGPEELKTHCKFLIIIKEYKKHLKIYSHIGTGNYNEQTSKVYTDLSYFTSSNKIGYDLINVFNLLSGCSDMVKMEKISVSPFNTRMKLIMLIDREIENHKKGLTSGIIFKINSLSDRGIIEKLYEAAEEGVKIDIICRGICSMKKIHKNINIKSVIGRFLEHSRIFYFCNNDDIRLFISSADLLTRNLDRRIEIMVPISSNKLKLKLETLLNGYICDTWNSFSLSESDSWVKLSSDDYYFDIHEELMKKAMSSVKFKKIPKISLKNINK